MNKNILLQILCDPENQPHQFVGRGSELSAAMQSVRAVVDYNLLRDAVELSNEIVEVEKNNKPFHSSQYKISMVLQALTATDDTTLPVGWTNYVQDAEALRQALVKSEQQFRMLAKFANQGVKDVSHIPKRPKWKIIEDEAICAADYLRKTLAAAPSNEVTKEGGR